MGINGGYFPAICRVCFFAKFPPYVLSDLSPLGLLITQSVESFSPLSSPAQEEGTSLGSLRI